VNYASIFGLLQDAVCAHATHKLVDLTDRL
jgi:hypothetical protein